MQYTLKNVTQFKQKLIYDQNTLSRANLKKKILSFFRILVINGRSLFHSLQEDTAWG